MMVQLYYCQKLTRIYMTDNSNQSNNSDNKQRSQQEELEELQRIITEGYKEY